MTSFPEAFRLREEAVLRADLGQLSDALNNARQANGAEASDARAPRMSIAFQDTLIQTLTQRV